VTLNYGDAGEVNPIGETRNSGTGAASGAANSLLTVSTATGNGALIATTTRTYDAIGNPLTVTDPLSNTTRYRYDAMRQIVGAIAPQAASGAYRTVRTTYNADGTVASVEQGPGHFR
jgi:YD repeat-containing protein